MCPMPRVSWWWSTGLLSLRENLQSILMYRFPWPAPSTCLLTELTLSL
jgi:hypothetical protein